MPLMAWVSLSAFLVTGLLTFGVGKLFDRMKNKVDPNTTDLKRVDRKYYFVTKQKKEIEVTKIYWLTYKALFVALVVFIGLAAISLGIFVVGYLMAPSARRIFGS